ncbi:MAG: hypothetical protein J6K39_04475 [Clostridia bacterium]|nr:hypothetical protein [Clostridia bacterium]
MSFLYLFDLLDFDANGNVAAGKSVSLEESRSNYLYLLSKYNQAFLQEEKVAVPQFFKEELSSVLSSVEKGGDFAKAKKQVLSNCLSKVQKCAEGSDKTLILALNDQVSVSDKNFADKVGNETNNLKLEYIITIFSGKVFDNICSLQAQAATKENKSKLFKEVIKYNSLVSSASKVRENKAAMEEVAAKVS